MMHTAGTPCLGYSSHQNLEMGYVRHAITEFSDTPVAEPSKR